VIVTLVTSADADNGCAIKHRMAIDHTRMAPPINIDRHNAR